MKVLAVIPYVASSYGGTSEVVKSLARALGQRKLAIDVVTTNADDASILNLNTCKWHLEKYYRIQYFPTWHRGDFILSLSLIRWLFHNVKDYDIVHTHTLFAPLITFTHKLCHFYKVPYIVTPHGMLDPWALAYKAWKKRFYYTCFEQSAIGSASAIQVLSSSEVEQVNKLSYLHTVLLPNGIHYNEALKLPAPELFYEQFPHLRTKRLVLFLGRIDPKKGLDLLALAFAKTHQIFPESHLILAGPDSINFTPKVQSYFDNAKCLDSVTFTGMLSGELKQAALATADVYVSPSYSEGFSMSVLEAMASGLPCVITTGCNFPEAAAAQAAHVVDIDADAIAKALIDCLGDVPAAKAMGDRARQFVLNHYTWDQIAAQLIDVYAAILSKRQS